MPSAARPRTIARFAWLVADETRADARSFSAVSTWVTCPRIPSMRLRPSVTATGERATAALSSAMPTSGTA